MTTRRQLERFNDGPLLRFFLIVAAIVAAIAAASSPTNAQAQTYYGGGGGGSDTRATFIICSGQPCIVSTDLTNPWIATKKSKLKKCWAVAKRPPAGGPIVIDLRANAVSVFGAQPKLTIPAGSSAVATVATFDAPNLLESTILRIDITAVGSTYAGGDVTVVCSIG